MTREMNLVGAIRALEDSLFEIEKKFNDEVKPYKDGLEILKKLNTACTKCAGVGKILKSCNNINKHVPNPNKLEDYEWCDRCGGTGIEPK